MFSSKSFIVFSLTFKSLIHFEFSFVYGVREFSNFILLHVAVQFSQHHLLKRLYFLHCIFFPPLSIKAWFISENSPLFFFFISGITDSLPQSQCPHIFYSVFAIACENVNSLSVPSSCLEAEGFPYLILESASYRLSFHICY